MFRDTSEQAMNDKLQRVQNTINVAFGLSAETPVAKTAEQRRFDEHLAEVSNSGAVRIDNYPHMTFGS